MKRICLIFLAIISAILLTSCYSSPSHSHNFGVGYLRIYNNTHAPVTITWTADNSQDQIDASSSRLFEFDMKGTITDPKSISTTYICEGLYLHSVEITSIIDPSQTTIRELNPDRGCINFVNNTAGNVDITIPGITDPITIPAYGHYIQAWLLLGQTDVASFTFSGDFVFNDSDQQTVNLNATGTYTIDATAAAIKVTNNSPVPITEVYLSPNSDTGWGVNDLSGTIAPGNYVIFTVTPNTWDVKVVDAVDFISLWTNNDFIDYNQMLIINFSKKKDHVDNSTKKDGPGSPHTGQFRIQQVK